MTLTPYLTLLEALRVSCNLPEFPDPLPSTQLDLELENGPTVTIDFEEESECVEIFSQIGTYSSDQEKEVLKKIAEANFLWTSTAGGTLSARPEIKTVYFAYKAPVLSLTGTDFVHLIEKFVEIVHQWQQFLSGNTIDAPINTITTNSSSIVKEKEDAAPPTPGSKNIIVG
ncbi:MAG: type III secretion system chaperone [Chthoniobacterales bacterium]